MTLKLRSVVKGAIKHDWRFMIDTGSESSLLNEKSLYLFNLNSAQGIPCKVKTLNGDIEGVEFEFEVSTVDQAFAREMPLRFVELPSEVNDLCFGLLGRDLLCHFTVQLDMASGVISYDPNGPASALKRLKRQLATRMRYGKLRRT